MKKVRLGFLGFGNIGSGVWKLINDMHQDIKTKYSLDISVEKILVKNKAKKRDLKVEPNLLTENPDEVLLNPDIDIIVEFLGGEQPAAEYMLKALNNGKTVVTANKMAFALHWPKLQEAAKITKSGLYYEAAVCGAIPIINAVTESMQANKISLVYGIVNGTTNDILTRMTNEGLSFNDALKIAQDQGLAEPDPTSDVEGFDAAYKLSILSSLCFHCGVKFEDIYIEGISNVRPEDIKSGAEFGYTLKLMVIAKQDGNKIEARVHPTFIPSNHPMANINGSMNAVYLYGHACEEMMFMGRGAGSMPTASAVVSDIIRSTEHKSHIYPNFDHYSEISFDNNWKSRYFIGISANDTPGVLSRLAGYFAAKNVGIASIQQKGQPKDGRVPLVFITHSAYEKDLRAALDSIKEDTALIKSMYRVEE